ncbi:MAG: hypothetical protein V4558_08910 [Gemmatimonadota bacterium]
MAPSLLTYNRGTLYVFDNAEARIVALDATTGASRWKVGRAGAGPLEFGGVAAIAPDRDGGVAVVDIRDRRVTRWSGNGELVGTISLGAMGGQPNQLCALSNDRLLLADVFAASLNEMDSTGKPVAKRAPIWPDLVGAKWESHQVVLRNSPDLALCIAALTSGRGFAILTERRPPRVVRYVESFDAYAVGPRKDEKEMSYWATFDAAITADTVMVLFAGRTADLNRLIDRYSATSGGYLDSYRLPFATKRFAAGGGLIFVADSTGTSVLGLRPGRLKSVSGR